MSESEIFLHFDLGVPTEKVREQFFLLAPYYLIFNERNKSDWRLLDLFIKRYGLDGHPPRTIMQLSDEYRIGRARVDQQLFYLHGRLRRLYMVIRSGDVQAVRNKLYWTFIRKMDVEIIQINKFSYIFSDFKQTVNYCENQCKSITSMTNRLNIEEFKDFSELESSLISLSSNFKKIRSQFIQLKKYADSRNRT